MEEHITDAPWVVVLFRQTKRERGGDENTYYPKSPAGLPLDCSYLRSQHGISAYPHPSPMGFLEILGRPEHEHAMLLMQSGYPRKKG